MKDSDQKFLQLAYWGQIADAIYLVGGVENDNFKVIDPRGSTIGVLRRYRTKSLSEVLPEVIMLENLKGSVNCSTPIPGHDGRTVYEVGGRPVVMWKFIEGRHLTRQQFSLAEFKQLGIQLRKLHAATRVCRLRRYFDPEETIKTALDLSRRLEQEPYSPLAKELHTEIEATNNLLLKTPPVFAMIHADISEKNTILTPDGRLWLIDFDDASFGACILDYAIAFRNLVLKNFDGRFISGLTSKFAEVRPLLEECGDFESLHSFGDWVRFATFRYFVLMLHLALKTGSYPAANEKNFCLLSLARELREELNALGTAIADCRKYDPLAA